jgi:hypothetical protein
MVVFPIACWFLKIVLFLLVPKTWFLLIVRTKARLLVGVVVILDAEFEKTT